MSIAERFYRQHFLGFDNVVNLLTQTYAEQKYPPHDIFRRSDTDFQLDIAVAGFKREQLSIVHDPMTKQLIISGDTGVESEVETKDTVEYVRKGIARRPFKLVWNIAEFLSVTEATITDGILSVRVQGTLPEKQPVSINISTK